MPYIKPSTREDVIAMGANTPGELNFLLTTIVRDYLKKKGRNYGNINEAIGVLECAKLELYRRIAAPYENEKIEENGDVY